MATNEYYVKYENSKYGPFCFFCGRDLSEASQVQYVAEGPVCSLCLIKIVGHKDISPHVEPHNPYYMWQGTTTKYTGTISIND